MIESRRRFLVQHKSSPDDVSYKETATAISAEEGNLQAILLQTTTSSGTPELIEDLLILAHHLQAIRPRTIEHALKFNQAFEGNSRLLGSVLFCYGNILFNLYRYDDAIKQYTVAREISLSISEFLDADRTYPRTTDSDTVKI
ncbi:hypothetical protein LshimejAT787_1204350 [Lyophyllum shimeji]|uniref:Uncharacterized protein n=1 Tax=Lyophyllum shimeji TaxID=47721 RepID=A0A9P3UUA7_LYOSH|nr:hypothetical protein LshimejAT787_1204350 [Lyophyllum shimeji]